MKRLINIIKLARQQNRIQNELMCLIPKQKGLIKIRLPLEYIKMIKTLAEYGIKDNKTLTDRININ